MSRSYTRVYVPVDASGFSIAAIDLAVDLAVKLGAAIIGSHVSSASDGGAGLDFLEECCRGAGVAFARRSLTGREDQVILADIRDNAYELVVMGALGTGAVSESQIGSVARRVVRGATTDVLIVKDLLPGSEGPIVAAVDGSPQSIDALGAALELGRGTGRGVEGIVVGESTLTGETSAAIEAARAAAAAEGTDLEVTITEGKPFDRILSVCRERRPWLLVVGRTGAGAVEDQPIGSTTDNLLRLATCNVLVAPGQAALQPATEPPGSSAGRQIAPRRRLTWTEEAERLIEDVPEEQRTDMVRTIEEGARRMGIAIITAETIDKVMLGYIE